MEPCEGGSENTSRSQAGDVTASDHIPAMGNHNMYTIQNPHPEELSLPSGGITDRYARFLVRCPWLPLLLVVIINVIFGVVSFFYIPFPDFSEPIEGFEARGTAIKGRLNALSLLRGSGLKSEPYVNQSWLSLADLPFNRNNGQNTPADTTQDRTKRNVVGNFQDSFSSYECIRESYVDAWEFHIVIGGQRQGSNLWNIQAIKAICSLEDQLVQHRFKTCRTPSMAHYIAKIAGVDCNNMTQQHLDAALDVLHLCAAHYHQGKLLYGCSNNTCPDVPWECIKGNTYIIFQYLTDSNFMTEEDINSSKQPRLTYTGIFLPYYDKDTYYKEMFADKTWENEEVKVIGVDSSPKMELFQEYIVSDLVFFGLAIGLILLFMCIYLRSLAVTVATVLDVGFSLCIAYFLYHMVFQIEYFPFMNLLTGLIVIAIGADDVFIMFDTWQQVKMEHPGGDLVVWMKLTLHHAILSIFVTSLTTASAFFASFVSEITSIKCFAIFSGVAILANFLMMLLWIPPIIICIEKVMRCCTCIQRLGHGKWCQRCVWGLHKISRTVYAKWLPDAVVKFWYIWIILFSCTGIGGIVVVFISPKLKLPSSADFQMFKSSNPLEQYESLKNEFPYNQAKQQQRRNYGMDVHLVWGIQGKDNGNALNPDDEGQLELDSSFNMSSKDAQVWMNNFFLDLKNSSLPSKTSKSRPAVLEWFNQVMTSNCLFKEQHPCCSQAFAPFEDDLFRTCVIKLIKFLPPQMIRPLGAPLFDRTNEIKAFYISFTSVQPLTASFVEMDQFYKDMDAFMTSHNSKAPVGMKNGWFVSELKFYDLQAALSSGTYVAIGVSLTAASVVMLLTSLNVLITLYAIVTIAFSISVTVAILVLLGWELNILESVVISLAVGLSIDFSIHYGVAYRLSDEETRKGRVQEAFGRVGSAVFMAAFTTFLAGAAMMPCMVLSYTQLGTFLMLVMVVSWLYATFFFQALCSIIGPQGNIAQIPSPFLLCKHKNNKTSTGGSNDRTKLGNGVSSSNGVLSDPANNDRNIDMGHENKSFQNDVTPLKYL